MLELQLSRIEPVVAGSITPWFATYAFYRLRDLVMSLCPKVLCVLMRKDLYDAPPLPHENLIFYRRELEDLAVS